MYLDVLAGWAGIELCVMILILSIVLDVFRFGPCTAVVHQARARVIAQGSIPLSVCVTTVCRWILRLRVFLHSECTIRSSYSTECGVFMWRFFRFIVGFTVLRTGANILLNVRKWMGEAAWLEMLWWWDCAVLLLLLLLMFDLMLHGSYSMGC